MAVKVIWGERALRKLEQIADYIAEDSPDRAADVVLRIYERVQLLADFPMSGRAVPELRRATIREVIVYDYRVQYHLNADAVFIRTILHARQDFHKVKKRLRKNP